MRRGLFTALLPALFLAHGAAVDAAPPVKPQGPNGAIRIRLPATVTLEPVTVAELLNGSSTTVPFVGYPPPAPVPPQIVRDLPDIWRVVQPPPHGNGAIQVDYELRGANGVADQLSMPGAPGSVILVQLEHLPSTRQSNGNEVVTRGGVRFLMDVNQALRAGPYEGTLTVIVNRL